MSDEAGDVGRRGDLRWRLLPLAVIGAFMLVGAWRCGFLHKSFEGSWDTAHREQSVVIGDAVVAALRRYHTDHGAFPPDLGVLTPEYMARIEPPVAGVRRWFYRLEAGGQDFTLYFGQRTLSMDCCYPLMYFIHSKDRWRIDN